MKNKEEDISRKQQNETEKDEQNEVVCMCKPIEKIQGKTATDILTLYGLYDDVPIDLKKLFKCIGISCLPYDFSDMENGNQILGALATQGDNAVIYYRTQDVENGHRYRFTIAHELAHCCLKHYPIGSKTVHYNYRSEENNDSMEERDANIFAGELLIPLRPLKRVIGQLLAPSVHTLAEIFEVSDAVMLARLKYLQIQDSIAGYN